MTTESGVDVLRADGFDYSVESGCSVIFDPGWTITAQIASPGTVEPYGSEVFLCTQFTG
jgi:hypothetical protein